MTERSDTSDANLDPRLIPVRERADILDQYRATPVETLLAAHNLGERLPSPQDPQLIIATCMDHRIAFNMPERFAFVLRTAGANVESLMFNIAAAIAVRDVRAVAIIGHSQCAMVNVGRHRDAFIKTVSSLGSLSEAQAAEIFEDGAREFGIDDAVSRTIEQCKHIGRVLTGVLVSPLYFDVDDGRLYQIRPDA